MALWVAERDSGGLEAREPAVWSGIGVDVLRERRALVEMEGIGAMASAIRVPAPDDASIPVTEA